MGANLDNAIALSKGQRERQQRQQGHRPKAEPKKRKINPPVMPTPERMAKDDFALADVHHYESETRTEAFSAIPWHVTQEKREALTQAQCKIIAKYKHQWEICEEGRSEIKSNLDQEKSGGEYNPFKFLEARKQLNHWNARLGRTEANEFVLVCCKGRGYKGAAIALFGENSTRLDAERIKRRFIKSLGMLDRLME